MTKKLLMIITLLSISHITFAESKPIVSLPTQQYNEPKVIFSIAENTPTGIKTTNQNAISQTNPNHVFCWFIYDIAETSPIKVVEYITSPNRTTFEIENTQTLSSADGKQHQVTTYITPIEGKINRCWKFDKQDPLGVYQIELKINDMTFPKHTFTIIK